MSTVKLPELPRPRVVQELDFEKILTEAKADFLQRYPEMADVIDLESEPINKLLQTFSYRELLYRARVNDAARSHLLAFATGADLDHLGGYYNLQRMAGESDDRYRTRLQLRIAALAGQGTREHYELIALSTDPQIKAARAWQPEVGQVQVLLWLHPWPEIEVNPYLPPEDTAQAIADAKAEQAAQTEAIRQRVDDALNADNARMLGVWLRVAIAKPRPINITATLTRQRTAAPGIIAEVEANLRTAFDTAATLGQQVAKSYITTLLHVQGIAAVRYPDATAPAVITTLAVDEYPTLGTVTLTDGGVSNT